MSEEEEDKNDHYRRVELGTASQGETLKKTLYEIFRGKIAKEVVGTSTGLG
jgi:hypothetical protein